MLTFLCRRSRAHVVAARAGAWRRTLATRRPARRLPIEIALGWHIDKAHDGEIVWHNGGTGGYRTFIGFDPRARIGVVVLSNTARRPAPTTSAGICWTVFRSSAFPQAPAKSRTETKVDPVVFDRYVGRYQLAPSAILT